jgi:ABC-type Co2+ transport system permease subunit
MPAGLRVLRHLDIVFLVCTLPIFIGADLPILGWIGGSAAYIVQRLISELLTRSAAQAEDVAGFMGVMVGGTIARGFFVALAIFGVGIIDGDAGAAAGALFLAAFTIYFTMVLILRPYAGRKK